MNNIKNMPRKTLIVFFAVVAIAISGCTPKKIPLPKKDKLIVVTSIFPIADIIKNVGGKRVEVIALIQPGQSPHTFEPLPRDMEIVSRADVFATVGFGLEFWADKLTANVQNPKMIRIVYADYVTPIGNENDPDAHGNNNPHIWLSPKIAVVIAEKTRDALTKAMPAAAPEFAANCTEYTAKLKKLDSWMTSVISGMPNRKFIAFHSAWSYLARDYGLEQVASIEEFPGKEPTPEKLARLIDDVRKLHVKAVFAEPQFNPKVADVIATEAGIKVSVLDPEGSPASDGRETYIKLMEYNVKTLADALK